MVKTPAMRNPLRLLLLQVLPILVFLVVDSLVEDPAWAIGAALLFVAFQAFLTLLRRKKLDAFIAVDALLISGMGAVSLLTENDLFFMLKPAILEGLMVPYLAFLALAPDKLLIGYFERYGGGLAIPAAASGHSFAAAFGVMRKLLLWLAAGILLHAGAVVCAALLWSRQTWGWVSGPGFYLLLVPFAIWVLWRRWRFSRARPPVGPGKSK